MNSELSRRSVMTRMAQGCLGVGLLPSMEHLFSGKALAAGEGAALAKQAATARNVIFLYMTGGQSHLDTWDPKPNNKEVAGPVKAIKTSADGVQCQRISPAHRQADAPRLRHQLDGHQHGCARAGKLLHAHQLWPAQHDQASGHGRVAELLPREAAIRRCQLMSTSATTAVIQALASSRRSTALSWSTIPRQACKTCARKKASRMTASRMRREMAGALDAEFQGQMGNPRSQGLCRHV
jgi:hypothetical protein